MLCPDYTTSAKVLMALKFISISIGRNFYKVQSTQKEKENENKMSYEDTGGTSVFNAGILMTERIDSLQRAINAARFNPLAQNVEVGRFNYEIMVCANDGLLNECWSKLNAKEKVQGDRIRKIVITFLELNPIIVNANGETKVNRLNYKKFMELIDIYEKTNKIFLDAHRLNSPNVDDDDEGY
jgi:hypothetical protein